MGLLLIRVCKNQFPVGLVVDLHILIIKKKPGGRAVYFGSWGNSQLGALLQNIIFYTSLQRHTINLLLIYIQIKCINSPLIFYRAANAHKHFFTLHPAKSSAPTLYSKLLPFTVTHKYIDVTEIHCGAPVNT